MTRAAVVFSCEHGGRRVPPAFRELFTGQQATLDSHRGWDPGSLALGRALAAALDVPLIATTTTRLLVEVNRSLGHPKLFSEFTRSLPAALRLELIERWYRPHRDRVEAAIAAALAGHDQVLHIGVHSFTPILDGRDRRCDVAWLYDPSREPEKTLSTAWSHALAQRRPELRRRRNHPYRGVADGLVTHFRRHFGARYLGLELEVSQALAAGPPALRRRLHQDLAVTLDEALEASGAR